MTDLEARAFAALFRDAYRKCFKHEPEAPLSEPESRRFSSEILERTGLVIGWKSLKNYSQAVLRTPGHKPENPTTATLDTLARYVLDAPVTDEPERKRREPHFPYWFQYRETHADLPEQAVAEPGSHCPPRRRTLWYALLAGVVLLAVVLIAIGLSGDSDATHFEDEFATVDDEALRANGWSVGMRTDSFWVRRGERPDHLTLFTLRGDNWPAAGERTGIPNLIMRPVPDGCFVAEAHLSDFYPTKNWQQAGMLLLEDTTITSRSLRMSIAYNDYMGGFPEPPVIHVQAIASGGPDLDRPEEIAHHQLFALEAGLDSLVRHNLAHAALRIERNADGFRLLQSNGALENTAFREIVRTTVPLRPRYVALFAVSGFVDSTTAVPAHFDAFRLSSRECEP
ncbi:MAG TPA: hypothetical protein VF190_14075 [Rhodothermales bacterium]